MEFTTGTSTTAFKETTKLVLQELKSERDN